MATTEIIDDVDQAGLALRSGKIVAFATETVYGLGADATNPTALQKLFQAKGRPSDNPLIVHLATLADWPLAAQQLPESARSLLLAFSPGPLTVVVPKSKQISEIATAGLDSVGIRIPASAQARSVIASSGRPIAAPSANLSGRPSCTTWQSVIEDLDGRIDYVLRGEPSSVGLESTVVDCTGTTPIVLRQGKITVPEIQAIIPSTVLLAQDQPKDFVAASSPGLRHPHYQPLATVRVFETLSQLFTSRALVPDGSAIGILQDLEGDSLLECDKALQQFTLVSIFDSVDQYSKQFYEFLRTVDRRGLATVYIQLATNDAAGAALRDRQLRAAGLR